MATSYPERVHRPPTQTETLSRHEAGLEQDPLDATGTLPVSGRVLDPEGNPVAGTIIYVYHFNMSRGDPGIVGSDVQSGRVAATAVNGHFQFQLDKGVEQVDHL